MVMWSLGAKARPFFKLGIIAYLNSLRDPRHVAAGWVVGILPTRLASSGIGGVCQRTPLASPALRRLGGNMHSIILPTSDLFFLAAPHDQEGTAAAACTTTAQDPHVHRPASACDWSLTFALHTVPSIVIVTPKPIVHVTLSQIPNCLHIPNFFSAHPSCCRVAKQSTTSTVASPLLVRTVGATPIHGRAIRVRAVGPGQVVIFSDRQTVHV